MMRVSGALSGLPRGQRALLKAAWEAGGINLSKLTNLEFFVLFIYKLFFLKNTYTYVLIILYFIEFIKIKNCLISKFCVYCT